MEGSVAKDVWGPSLWSAMHSLSFSYPAACEAACPERAAMFDFLKALKVLIPCEECKAHYSEWFNDKVGSKASRVLAGRDDLSRSLVSLHNEVNARENKASVAYDDVKRRYLTGKQKSCKVSIGITDVQTVALVTLIALVVIGIVVFSIFKFKKR